MLNLRIVRGPLLQPENEAILSEYNRHTSSEIPAQEFLHWIQKSPEGPAWHAILETENAEIVGHQCLIPFRGSYGGKRFVAAKSEYTFLREEYRATRIRGFKRSVRPIHLVAANQLLQHCQSEGWGPFLISTLPALHRWARSVGCQPTNFSVRECLLVLRPWSAARKTPNLLGWQRAVLSLTGIVQQIGWSPILFSSSHPSYVRSVRLNDRALPNNNGSLSFFEDQDSLGWRYSKDQYERLALGANGEQYLIIKEGFSGGYLRVCQWRLGSDQPSLPLITSLVRRAQEQKALGVRWAVYGDNESAKKLVQRMLRFGFLCARRRRIVLIHAKEKDLLVPEHWNLSDAMFSFHTYTS